MVLQKLATICGSVPFIKYIYLLSISLEICVGVMILIAHPIKSIFSSITASNLFRLSSVNVFESIREKRGNTFSLVQLTLLKNLQLIYERNTHSKKKKKKRKKKNSFIPCYPPRRRNKNIHSFCYNQRIIFPKYIASNLNILPP